MRPKVPVKDKPQVFVLKKGRRDTQPEASHSLPEMSPHSQGAMRD